jgi:Methyltransferase domain
VVDIGGGAGVYALALAREGYTVRLLDPMALHVEQARAAGLNATLGDARALPFTDESADAAHPEEPAQELADAGFEAATVLAIEGPASFRDELEGWLKDPERRELLLRTIRRVEAEPTLLGASSHLLATAAKARPVRGVGRTLMAT